MVEAKDIATYIIEAVGADIYNPDSYLVRKRFQDTETTTSYPNTQFSNALQAISDNSCSASSTCGCRIYLKNGLYEMLQGPDTDGGLVEWSTTTNGHFANVYIEGETREGVKIQNIEAAPEETPTSRMFLVRCNFSIKTLSMDGGGAISGASLNGINAFGQVAGTGIIEVRDCRFSNMDGNNIGAGEATVIVENCIFEKPIAEHDQISLGCTNFARINNNFFDRTNGSYFDFGSTITAAQGKNMYITNNIIRRNQGPDRYAISLETGWGYNYDRCVIANNLVDNGLIYVGGEGSYSDTAINIYVTDNKLYQGGIYVQGPTSGSYSTQIKDVVVENNQLINSWEAGIHLDRLAGLCTVRNNVIKNSNAQRATYTGQEPLIFATSCTDPIIENNFLLMESDADANFSPEGIRYVNLVNPTIINNRILNRTIANNSYLSIGTHTGSVLISRNL
jgi:hypothetical protein